MKIKNDYPCRASRYSRTPNTRKYIVVHNTANMATAKQEALNCNRNHADSSFHYVLDGNEIYSSVPDNYTAWSVGAWQGCSQIIGNSESISIEVCSDCKEFTSEQKTQLRELVRYLMEKHGIDKDHVVRHYDCHTGHKRCPYAYSGNKTNDSKWKSLRNLICNDTYNYVIVQTYKANRTDSQKWQVIADKDGYATILNKKYGQALDCQNGKTSKGTSVGVWIPNGTDAQKWKLIRSSDSTIFEIINKKSNLALDVKDGNCEFSTPLQIWTRNDTKAQRFALIPTDDGFFYIVNAKSLLPLEIKGGKKSSR